MSLINISFFFNLFEIIFIMLGFHAKHIFCLLDFIYSEFSCILEKWRNVCVHHRQSQGRLLVIPTSQILFGLEHLAAEYSFDSHSGSVAFRI